MRYLVFSILLLASSIVQAQYDRISNPIPIRAWQINAFTGQLGVATDNYGQIDKAEIMQMAKNPEELKRHLQGFDEDITTSATGGALYFQANMRPGNKARDAYNDRQEWRLGLGINTAKEAMLSYKNQDLDTSVVYCHLQSEILVESAYLWKTKKGKFFQAYGGVGAGMGASFNNQMIMIAGKYFGPDEHPSMQESEENNVDKYQAKNIGYMRMSVPLGFSVTFFDPWHFGIELRNGVGFRKAEGESVRFLPYTNAVLLTIRGEFR